MKIFSFSIGQLQNNHEKQRKNIQIGEHDFRNSFKMMRMVFSYVIVEKLENRIKQK